nr:ABC transporter permease [Rubrobacter sp.]
MSVETEGSTLKGSGGRRAVSLLARYGTLAGLAVMIVGFSIASPDAFPTFSNLVNIVNQVALTAIIASGLTVVLIVDELDLSVGFGASLAGVLVTGLMVRQDLPVLVAIVAVVLV